MQAIRDQHCGFHLAPGVEDTVGLFNTIIYYSLNNPSISVIKRVLLKHISYVNLVFRNKTIRNLQFNMLVNLSKENKSKSHEIPGLPFTIQCGKKKENL